MLRIAHLSDIHFGGENFAAVAAAGDWLKHERPDLVVITGDLTAFGGADEFRRARIWVEALDLPVLVTPGNHDTPYIGLAARLLAPFALFERSFGPAGGTLWGDERATIAAFNTARGMQLRWNWSKGAVSRGQVDAAIASLRARAPGALAILACHHPLVEMIGGPMSGRVRGGEQAARRLCEGGVDLVLTGHIHAPFVWPFPWGHKTAYAVGAGTLSLRERGVPAGFNFIVAHADTIEVSATAWTGSRFETWRTWSLERSDSASATATRALLEK
ncbi:MAG: metallophosphoesterase family protein [Caulobacteraceae bacterium]